MCWVTEKVCRYYITKPSTCKKSPSIAPWAEPVVWGWQFPTEWSTGWTRHWEAFAAVVHSLSLVQLFKTPWTAARQVSLSFTSSQSLLKFVFIESMMLSNHLILCHPLLLLPSIFSGSGSFPMSQLFTWDGQSIGASASVLPMNLQGWFPLGLIDLISLQSKGLSRVFSSTTFKSINSAVLSLLYGPTRISVHDYWKNFLLCLLLGWVFFSLYFLLLLI